MKWRRTKPVVTKPRRKNHDFVIAFGLFLASVFDPKTGVQTEMLDRKDSRDRVDPGKENA